MKKFFLVLALSLFSACIHHVKFEAPNVLIVRGQDNTTCATGPKTKLSFFIFLRNMPNQEVLVRSNESPWARLFGTQLTVNVTVNNSPGYMSYHILEVKVAERLYEVSTIVVDCKGLNKEWSNPVE